MVDVVIEKVGKRIHAMAPYMDGINRRFKAVPGHNFRDKNKIWTYPCSMMVCRALRREFGTDLIIGPDLESWARKEARRERALVALSRANDAELRVVPTEAPQIFAATQTRPYQRAAMAFVREGQNVLLGHGTGLGKSLMIFGSIVECGVFKPGTIHLITAPKKTLVSTWMTQIRKWVPDCYAIAVPDGAERRARALDTFFTLPKDKPAFLIINPEMLQTKFDKWCKDCRRWVESDDNLMPVHHFHENHEKTAQSIEIAKQDWPVLFEVEWNSVSIDEAHRYLLGIKGAAVFKKTLTGEGYMQLKRAPHAPTIAATATPLRGKAKNFWPTFHFLAPEVWGSFWQMVNMFLETTDNGFGIEIGELKEENIEDFFFEVDKIMVRKTRTEVGLPPLMEPVDLWVDMTPAQRKQHEALVDEGEAQFGDRWLSIDAPIALFTRLKQLAFGEWYWDGPEDTGKLRPKSSPKAELLLEWLEERGVVKNEFRQEGGYKYLVASQFTEVVDYLERFLNKNGVDTLKITGAVTPRVADEAAWSFQNDPDGPRVLLISTTAAGFSLTLDAYCDEGVIMDETFVADDQAQVMGRIDNRNPEIRIAPRQWTFIRTNDSVEEAIAKSGLTQEEIQHMLLDKRRGVEFARRLLKGPEA